MITILPILVDSRRRAVGYEQSAEELLCRLIDLSDRFKIEHFQVFTLVGTL